PASAEPFSLLPGACCSPSRRRSAWPCVAASSLALSLGRPYGSGLSPALAERRQIRQQHRPRPYVSASIRGVVPPLPSVRPLAPGGGALRSCRRLRRHGGAAELEVPHAADHGARFRIDPHLVGRFPSLRPEMAHPGPPRQRVLRLTLRS